MRLSYLFLALLCLFSTKLLAQKADSYFEQKYNCSITTPINSNDKDPGTSINIHLDEGEWTILHFSRSGQKYIRNEQYRIKDTSARDLTWEGVNFKRPNVRMTGVLKLKRKDTFSYTERMYDMVKGGMQTAQIDAECVRSFNQEEAKPIVAPLLAKQPSLCKPNSHSVIPVIFNKPYNEARQMLIQAGWQPLLASLHMQEDYASNGNGPELWGLGFREVRGCSGTGLAYCSFDFKDSYGNLLKVTTTGEVSTQGKEKTWNVVEATNCTTP